MSCDIPGGCIRHEQSGACPLCDENGTEHIANWQALMDDALIGAGYMLDLVGEDSNVDLPRGGFESDLDYRQRLIARLRGEA
jgi:hypothetical protein